MIQIEIRHFVSYSTRETCNTVVTKAMPREPSSASHQLATPFIMSRSRLETTYHATGLRYGQCAYEPEPRAMQASHLKSQGECLQEDALIPMSTSI